MAVVQSEGALLSSGPPWWTGPRLTRSGIRYANGTVEDYAAIYRTQPNVRLVVNFLARNVAQLALRGYTIGDDETAELVPVGRRHGLSKTFRRPNPRTTRHRFVLALMHDLGIFDSFFSLKVRNPGSGDLRLFRLPPQHVEPDGGSWLFPDGYELVGIPGRRDKWTADQVFAIHGHNPEDPTRGLSPIESIRRILIEDTAASEYRAQFWQRGARMSGLIERPAAAPKWSDPARKRFREEWRELYAGTGPEAGGTPILEEGMKWVEASFSAKDSEYLAARRLSREECAAAWHVSPLFVGILDHANFSNVSEQHKHLYADTLGPWCDLVEEDVELQVVPEFEDLDVDDTVVRFDLDEKLRGSFSEEAQILQTATGAPWMLRNEARRRRGLAPVPGGDDLVVPLNVLVGGQASARDSAPAPSFSLNRRRRAHRVATAGGGNPVPAARAPKALPPGRRKAADELPNDVVSWHDAHLNVLVPFFERQASSVRSRLGAGQTVDAAFDADRWNAELEADLAGLAFEMAEELGTASAEFFGGTFDRAIAEPWLRENARIAAEKVNATTLASLEDALDELDAKARSAGTKADDDEELDELDVLDAVFDLAVGARAAELALTRTTSIGNFARREGAQQAGARSKVWVVNSSSSRHPELNGETVPIGETFSNGLLWPGDPNGDVADTAGCICSLEFTP